MSKFTNYNGRYCESDYLYARHWCIERSVKKIFFPKSKKHYLGNRLLDVKL